MSSEQIRNSFQKLQYFIFFIAIIIGIIQVLNNALLAKSRIEYTRAKVIEICTFLDAQTDACGVYIQSLEAQKSQDSWGSPLKITYSRGGVSEIVEVRSAGPDCIFFSNDDIVERDTSVNFSGLGNGILKGARSLPIEVISGFKESLKNPHKLEPKKK